MINYVLNILKPPILADISASQQHFLWYSRNSFQLTPSFFFNIYHHGPHLHRLFREKWLIQRKFTSAFDSSVSTCSFTPSPAVIENPAEKCTGVCFISMWMSQLHCCSHPCLISCLKYDQRKQKQKVLSQMLKGSIIRTDHYNICISPDKYNLFVEM